MDGYEVCRRIQSDPAGRDIPVIFLTAKAAPEDEVMGLGVGAVDYVTKPFNVHRLNSRIHTHLALAQAQRRLAVQNTELIEAAKLREDMEKIMHHDLKSPLNVIIGAPQYILMSCDLTETQRELLQGVEESGQRLLQMINMSLDLIKVERGSYELRPEPVDLIGITSKVFFELDRQAAVKSVELKVLHAGEVPTDGETCMAFGEPLLCYSLLANLCKNAIEASPDGGVVTVTVDTDTEARIVIENVGEVPADIRDQFFEKFVTAKKDGGTGLGTYSARLFAETQNGAIRLDTSPPGLTRVRVILPSAK